jgi:hypothetical protein
MKDDKQPDEGEGGVPSEAPQRRHHDERDELALVGRTMARTRIIMLVVTIVVALFLLCFIGTCTRRSFTITHFNEAGMEIYRQGCTSWGIKNEQRKRVMVLDIFVKIIIIESA